MSSWLTDKAPLLFEDLLLPEVTLTTITRTSLQANPPHLLLSGPAGVGKTATWRLMARQILGPTWEARTHILQARDLARTSGAMGKFEEFLGPKGAVRTTPLLEGPVLMHLITHFLRLQQTHLLQPASNVNTRANNEQQYPVSLSSKMPTISVLFGNRTCAG